ncbi:MAG: beta-lactamase family protein [Bacteroidetes bacterium]|nr:beta-lactamase family protein [Bacteroidota bacterium]
MQKSTIVFFICLLSLAVVAQPQPIEQKLQHLVDHTPAVGLAVVVVKKNKIIYQQYLGYKNIETKEPLTGNSLFRIASISKSFTATALLQLVEQKQISLYDDVSNLIGFTVRNPSFPEEIITLGQLLSHRSSLNDSQGYFNLDVIDPARNTNFFKCYNNYAPGNGYQYCNLNFNMAGAILERITGVRFDTYIKQTILTPLGIEGGYCVDSLASEKFATLYEYNAAENKFIASTGAYTSRSSELIHYQMGRSTPLFSPTGGLKISAKDLATYMMMHSRMGKYKGGRLLKKKTATLMQTPLSVDGIDQYGLALWKTNKLIPGITLTGHTGSAYGLNSALFFDPITKNGMIIICNGSRESDKEGYPLIIRETIRVLYEEFLSN